eukprot:7975159-Lingulodinium_polyedra.AAC.1
MRCPSARLGFPARQLPQPPWRPQPPEISAPPLTGAEPSAGDAGACQHGGPGTSRPPPVAPRHWGR